MEKLAIFKRSKNDIKHKIKIHMYILKKKNRKNNKRLAFILFLELNFKFSASQWTHTKTTCECYDYYYFYLLFRYFKIYLHVDYVNVGSLHAEFVPIRRSDILCRYKLYHLVKQSLLLRKMLSSYDDSSSA